MTEAETALRDLLADPAQAGAYFVDARDREALLAAAPALGFALAVVDFSGCTGKDDALARIAHALGFPDWFGGNWDALADCLFDLGWRAAPGHVLVLDHVEAWRADARTDFDTLLEILNEAAGLWALRRTPFWALLPVDAALLATLEA